MQHIIITIFTLHLCLRSTAICFPSQIIWRIPDTIRVAFLSWNLAGCLWVPPEKTCLSLRELFPTIWVLQSGFRLYLMRACACVCVWRGVVKQQSEIHLWNLLGHTTHATIYNTFIGEGWQPRNMTTRCYNEYLQCGVKYLPGRDVEFKRHNVKTRSCPGLLLLTRTRGRA